MAEQKFQFRHIHTYGTVHAPNWQRHKLLDILFDRDHLTSVSSDQISPLGRPDDPPHTIPYSAGYKKDGNRVTFYSFMNDTAHLPIDEITFGGRKVDVQLLMFTWFDYFQYADVEQQAQSWVDVALKSSIPLGLIVDITVPKQFQIVRWAYMRDGKFMGKSSTFIDIPDPHKPHLFHQPEADDVRIFMDMLGLDCPHITIDRDTSQETVRRAVDDLISRCFPNN